ncbi:hypothetical protein LXA43DRAFT_1068559 [Ganoderma leucocontextum]|nr:hypothetical protein LXA43DRAFT_1068559 [Ganoderma leucocontextum]
MDVQVTPTRQFVSRVPTHPIECLRAIVLPGCCVCGQPTRFMCGGCRASPAFCSAEHFMKLWPVHSLTCERVVNQYATASSDRGAEQAHPFTGTVSLPTRCVVDAPVPLTDIQLPMPVLHGRPYDYTVTAMYAKHDGDPVPETAVFRIQDCFQSTSTIRSFVVRHNAHLLRLDAPLHVFYCATSYDGRVPFVRALVWFCPSTRTFIQSNWTAL